MYYFSVNQHYSNKKLREDVSEVPERKPGCMSKPFYPPGMLIQNQLLSLLQLLWHCKFILHYQATAETMLNLIMETQMLPLTWEPRGYFLVSDHNELSQHLASQPWHPISKAETNTIRNKEVLNWHSDNNLTDTSPVLRRLAHISLSNLLTGSSSVVHTWNGSL